MQINAAVQQAALLQASTPNPSPACPPNALTKGISAASSIADDGGVNGGAVAGPNAGVEALRLELSLMSKQLQKVQAELEQSRQATAVKEEELENIQQELARYRSLQYVPCNGMPRTFP
jgi:hypothetical protein